MLTWRRTERLRFAESVTPVGMAVGMLARDRCARLDAVTDHVLPLDNTAVGAATPADAELITSDGVPVTAIWLIAVTWKVTVCVAD